MKVFDLCCQNDHLFEGWFDSAEDFDKQTKQGLVVCPICGSRQVQRRPSAPYIGAGSRDMEGSIACGQSDANKKKLEKMREEVMAYVLEASKTATDVGKNFVPEVRAMHEGSKPVRNVKGLCTEKDRKDLLKEGIVVLPIPESAGKTLN